MDDGNNVYVFDKDNQTVTGVPPECSDAMKPQPFKRDAIMFKKDGKTIPFALDGYKSFFNVNKE